MHLPTWSSALLCTLAPLLAHALSLDLTSSASIKNASSIVAKDVLSYYHGTEPGQVYGIFGESYSWGEAGAVWGSLIDYWNYTGDAQYVDLVQKALLWQVGPNNDYMTPNQTADEANNDQAIWALAAMRAAELRFPNPSTSPSWLDLAINAFNDQASRWNTSDCSGGLRWQIFPFNKGYNYKNAISTGAFFQLAARLARYTGNQTYADWATNSYDWTSSVGLISHDHKVFDGTMADGNCSLIDRIEWTYTAGTFMYGSAVMTNFTNANANAKWKIRTNGLLSSMSVFFTGANNADDSAANPGIMAEVACEPFGSCDSEQYAFKGLTAQWMGEAMQVAPFTTGKISSYLQSSAEGAAKQCSGGDKGTACGTQWTKEKYDGNTGLGQELSALNVFLANLAVNSSAPINANTTAAVTAQAKGTTSASSTTTTSGNPTATSSKPSSGSQRSWAAGWTLSLVMPAALLSLSIF